MFSPEASGPASVAARNPRRRQRNASEDSVAFRPNVKRIRRSGLTQETFVAPDTTKLNGHAHDVEEAPRSNGHTPQLTTQGSEDADPANMALRPKGSKRQERERKPTRNDGIELVCRLRTSKLIPPY